MKKLLFVAAAVFFAAAACGCRSDRVRDIELEGMFTQAESGTVAIGSVEIQAAPKDSESVSLKMWWDSPLLAPSEVRPCARLMISGTNSCAKAADIVNAITKAVGVNFYRGCTNGIAAADSGRP